MMMMVMMLMIGVGGDDDDDSDGGDDHDDEVMVVTMMMVMMMICPYYLLSLISIYLTPIGNVLFFKHAYRENCGFLIPPEGCFYFSPPPIYTFSFTSTLLSLISFVPFSIYLTPTYIPKPSYMSLYMYTYIYKHACIYINIYEYTYMYR
jgi:hypothetical protein